MWTETQALSFKDQLGIGIRYFDLRVKRKNNVLGLYHGEIFLDLMLPDVIDTIAAFLKSYPTECVLACFKNEGEQEHDGEILRRLQQEMDRHPGLFHTGCGVPTVGAVRGKIVVMNRISPAPSMGVYIDFPSNATAAAKQRQSDNSVLETAIQDVYAPAIILNVIDDKLKAIEHGYRTYSQGNYAFRLSFLSATSVLIPHAIASAINPRVDEFLVNWAGATPWITVMDYVGVFGEGRRDPVAAIVSANDLSGGNTLFGFQLHSGESLDVGNQMRSTHGTYGIQLIPSQNAGVRRLIDGELMFDSGFNNVTRMTLRPDGNVVLESGAGVLASTHTAGIGGNARLVMQNDGNLVLYDVQGNARWASRHSKFSPGV